MSHTASLFSSPLVAVRDHVCTVARGEPTPVRGGGTTYVRLVRRGCFYCCLGARTVLADPTVGYIHHQAGDYRASHPCEGGDDCTLFELEPDLLAEVFGPRRVGEPAEFSLSPPTQRRHLAVHAALKRGVDRMAGQEMALSLLHEVARRPCATGGGARQRQIVDRAKAFLNQHLAENADMAELAREVGCSPFHLMRLFRAETGLALRGYRARLRVAAVMEQLAGGAGDLTQLALDFGFTSHSHLTHTFQMVLGEAPSDLRQQLSRGGLEERRSFLASAA
jgi:AraC-like DNA-binding protein